MKLMTEQEKQLLKATCDYCGDPADYKNDETNISPDGYLCSYCYNQINETMSQICGCEMKL